MKPFAFPKTYRLLRRDAFDQVFAWKCSASDASVIVYASPNKLTHARIGLVVSRKVGGAVVRNRWKRLLREAFRLNHNQMPNSIDFVVLPRRGTEPNFFALQRSLVEVARRATNKMRRQMRRQSVS